MRASAAPPVSSVTMIPSFAPIAVVRTVSDRADDSAHVDFGRFVAEVAAAYSRDIVLGALQRGLRAA